jgi:hypothetical protein
MRNTIQGLDQRLLDHVRGGEDDPMGQTVLVAGRPQTCQAVVARGKWLFAQPDPPKPNTDWWLHEYRRLDDAFMEFHKIC